MKRVRPLCETCNHRGICEKPCEPVRLLLEDVESKYLRERRQGEYVILRNWREAHFFYHDDPEDGRNTDFEDTPENRLGVTLDGPASLQTEIFRRRVFLGESMADASAEMGVKARTLDVYFRRARARVLRILEFMNARQACVLWQKNTRHNLTTQQKAFVAYKLFGLPFKEVQQIVPDLPPFKTFSSQMRKLEKSYVGL